MPSSRGTGPSSGVGRDAVPEVGVSSLQRKEMGDGMHNDEKRIYISWNPLSCISWSLSNMSLRSSTMLNVVLGSICARELCGG